MDPKRSLPSKIKKGVTYLRENTSDDLKEDISTIGRLIKNGIYCISPPIGTLLYNSFRTDFSSTWKKTKATAGKTIMSGLASLVLSSMGSAVVVYLSNPEVATRVERMEFDDGYATFSYRDHIDIDHKDYIFRRTMFPVLEALRPSNYRKVEGNTRFKGQISKGGLIYQFEGTFPGNVPVDSIKRDDLGSRIEKLGTEIPEKDIERAKKSLFD